MSFNIESNDKKRVVIVGGGFGGLRFALDLKKANFQVVLIDKNNFHQFPPLIYQVATSGLHPSSISFPFRKIFEAREDFYFRMAELRAVFPKEKYIQTSIGKLDYDYLVLANGAKTNFFGNKNIEEAAMPMKTVGESMGLRNAILSNFERSVTCSTKQERQELLNVVIVGGGPTGVEVAGAIAEMRNYVIPKDYPDMEAKRMHIYLIQSSDRLLPGMSKKASEKSEQFLKKLGVDVLLYKRVIDYKDNKVILADGMAIPTRTFIWVCGVSANDIVGLDKESYGASNRLLVDEINRVKGYEDIFAIGDIALMLDSDPKHKQGHPQMAQPAIQQGANLAKNLIALENNKKTKPFRYRDLGCMATIGRNKAVADVFRMNFAGMFAWLLWMVVHLRSILGVRNKLAVLLDWTWGYITYDRSNRMILSAVKPKVILKREEIESKYHWGSINSTSIDIDAHKEHSEALDSLNNLKEINIAPNMDKVLDNVKEVKTEKKDIKEEIKEELQDEVKKQ